MSLTWNVTQSIVNTEVTGTFVFNDNDIRALYVDWDDGESNKLEESNYQWYQTTEPISTTTITHTYNSTGTFYPIIQAINSKGFVSRYYSANASEPDVKPFTQDTAVNSLGVYDSASVGIIRTTNTSVKSGIDNTVYDMGGPGSLYIATMPTLTDTELDYFSPIEIDITCVLDMSLVSGATSLGADGSEITGGGGQRIVETLTCILSGAGLTGNTGLKDVLASGSATNTALISGASVARVLEVKYKNPKLVGADANNYTKNAALNKLKIGLFTANPTYLSDSTYGRGLPICYITAGDPIKRANDVERLVTLDYSQSRTAAANTTVSEYFYDNGKMWFQPVDRWLVSGGASTLSAAIDATQSNIPVTSTANFPASGTAVIQAGGSTWEQIEYNGVTSTQLLNAVRGTRNGPVGTTHTLGSPIKVGVYFYDEYINNLWQFIYPKQSTQTKSMSYTYLNNPFGLTQDPVYNPWKRSTAQWSSNDATTFVQDQFALDDFGRFMEQSYLVRTQAKVGSVNSYKNLLNVPSVFRITPIRCWANVPGDSGADATITNARSNPTKILDSGASNADSDSYDYTENNWQNLAGTQVLLSGANDHVWRDAANTVRTSPLEEYLILLLDEKTDKLFMNMTNWAPYLQSSITTTPPWSIDSVSLLKIENSGTNTMNVFWEPVEFADGTESSKEYRDTTNDKYTTVSCSLSKSGVISYDMIDNWNSVKLEDLTGGQFSAYTTTSNSYDFGTMSGTVSGSIQTPATPIFGDYFVITGTVANDISSKLADIGLEADDIGSFRYIAEITSPSGYDKNAFWLSKDGKSGWDGDDTLYFHIGDSTETLRDNCESLTGALEFVIRRINIYDVFTGFSKVYKVRQAANSTHLLGVDSQAPAAGFDNTFTMFSDDSRGDRMGETIEKAWFGQSKYAIKIGLKGVMELEGSGLTDQTHPELFNIFDANQSNSAVVNVRDDSAFNLNSLAITSTINVGRAGTYYKAITHKGKVIITKTGIQLQEIGFSSVALGDENSTTAFDDHGPSTLYGHLHTLRKIQSEDCRVYWDEPQKDGTFLRVFGVVMNINETAGVGGPRRIVNYTFTLAVDGITLIDSSGKLMTDIFPLGGVVDEQTYT